MRVVLCILGLELIDLEITTAQSSSPLEEMHHGEVATQLVGFVHDEEA